MRERSMNHLLLRIATIRYVVARILLLLAVILIPLNTVTHHLSTPLTNQLQNSISSHIINPQESWLQEAVGNKPSSPVNHLTSNYLEGVEMNIATHTSEAFDGYNLFVLWEFEEKPPDFIRNEYRSLIVTNMEGEIIIDTVFNSFPLNNWDVFVKLLNSTTFLYGTKNGAALWNSRTDVGDGCQYVVTAKNVSPHGRPHSGKNDDADAGRIYGYFY